MKPILLISGGSRGDVQPFLMLGKALQQAGYPLLLALPLSYQEEARAAGLDFHPLRVDFDALLSTQQGQSLKNTGQNPLAVLREGRQMMKHIGSVLVEDVWELTADVSAVIAHIGLSACTQSIAALRQIPLIHVTLQPFMPTRAFPHPLLPIRRDFGTLYNQFTGYLVKRVTWDAFGGEINRFLKTNLNVPPVKWQDYSLKLDKTPVLNAFSPSIIPFPRDWKPNNHITGFWLSPLETDWQPPRDLSDFLENGSPPIFIGFGSVSDTASLDIVVEALQIAGHRGIVVTNEMPNLSSPENVFITTSLPYVWLFQHVKAVIHHGGAGTTAYALHAKRPMLAVPQLLDQFFWAERVFQKGAALRPIPNKKLTAVRLASAIDALTAEKPLQERASLIGEQMQGEDGLTQAVGIIQDILKSGYLT